MNGVSHMIPFVVTGGLLIALALAVGGEPTEAGMAIPPGSMWNHSEVGVVAFTLDDPDFGGLHCLRDCRPTSHCWLRV